MRHVERERLVLGGVHAPEDLLTYPFDQDLALHRAAQGGRLNSLTREQGCKRRVVGDPVLFAHPRQHAIDIRVRRLEAEVAGALDHQQFVDGIGDNLRRQFPGQLLQRCVSMKLRGRDRAPEMAAQRDDLTFVELGLGEIENTFGASDESAPRVETQIGEP